jgi:hypothetical protein
MSKAAVGDLRIEDLVGPDGRLVDRISELVDH